MPSRLECRPRAFARDGIVRRLAPWAIVAVVALAAVPATVDHIAVGTLGGYFAVSLALVAMVLFIPWPLLPAWTEGLVPIASIASIVWVRHETGASQSVYGVLFLLPIMWISLYGTHSELIAAAALSGAAYTLPVLLIGDPQYPPSEVVRGGLFAGVMLVVGFTVQGVVSRVRMGEASARVMQSQLAHANNELRMADDLKNRFVAMAGHELRTPLTSITGFSSTMSARWDELPDLKKRQYVGIIEQQSERLLRLVNDLLTVSRITAGELQANPQGVPVANVIEGAVAAVACEREIVVTCPETLVAHADPDQLHQVLLNFLANAIKYGADPIEVRACTAGTWAEVRVIDHGPGVPEDFVPRLFGKFAQAARGNTGCGGTGLGLSIVRDLARAQGGDAWFEPNEPRGSIFAVRVPVRAPASAHPPGQ